MTQFSKEINGICEASSTLFKLNSIPVEDRQRNHSQLEYDLVMHTEMLRNQLSWTADRN